MEFQCRDIVQRAYPSRGSPVENIPLQAERHSGERQKLFIFPPESVFTFKPECCSKSQRNGVQLQTGTAFIFDRIPHPYGLRVQTHLFEMPCFSVGHVFRFMAERPILVKGGSR